MKTNIFIKKTEFNCSKEELFEWHEREFALERLSPPFDPVKVISRKGSGIEIGAKVTIKMHAGLIPFIWKAEHTEYKKPDEFADIQVSGPFSFWKHTHTITDSGNKAFLEDKIEYSLPFGFILNKLFRKKIESNLSSIFKFRHKTLANDLILHSKYGKERKIILIAGASGQLGSALIPFFSTGGHKVIRLVRREHINQNEIFWDPSKGFLDLSKAGKIDAIINLSGENIGEGRWTKSKKAKIIESRTKTTKLLVDEILKLDDPPEVFISSSAIGFYGNTKENIVNEKSEQGSDFISEVCKLWEDAARSVEKAGVRLLNARIGVVCSPLGGALEKLITPTKMGFGGKLGSGKQHMSWIGMDDILGIFYYFIHDKKISGPVNICTPDSITNYDMIKAIGKALKRPTFFTVPSFIIKILFGKMGDEIVLSDMRVKPEVLINSSYEYICDDFDEYLKFVLGKN
ncbi:MAG: TIGR01777 family protein [Desulfobacterales bacterium]|nr:TIGR01777 family protein [Desulfobacterales bacterium]MCP4161711.1 TIGR01777 family protein [Deltaproteobacteria bacterium]